MALTSGGLEPVYDGGGDGYSVFARAFLEALRDNDRPLDGYGLYSRLRPQVVLAAEQTPRYAQIRLSDDEGGDFIFVPKGSTVVVVTPDEAPAGAGFDERAMELAFWDAVKDSRDAADFEAYLARYPKGTFAALARNRLKKLKKKQTAAVVTPPKPAIAPAPAQPTVGNYQGQKRDDEDLNADEVRSLVIDNTFTGYGSSGCQYFAYHWPDGSQTVQCGTWFDKGTWRIEGNRFCVKWRKTRNGAELCGTIRKFQDEYHYYVNGEYNQKAQMIAGNPKNLKK